MVPDALFPVCRCLLGAETKSLFNKGMIAKHGYQCSQEQLLQVELPKRPQLVHTATRASPAERVTEPVCVSGGSNSLFSNCTSKAMPVENSLCHGIL